MGAGMDPSCGLPQCSNPSPCPKLQDTSSLSLSSSKMVSCKAVAALLMVHVAVMLASQTEAFVPIFTYSEVQRMKVRHLLPTSPPRPR